MKRILILIICLLVGGIFGCGDDATVIDSGASALVSEGWAEYEAGNYGDAIVKFAGALTTDSSDSGVIDCDSMLTNVEAYDGIGWAKSRLGKTSDSIDNFRLAIEKGSANSEDCEDEDRAYLVYLIKDTYAGLAGMYLVEDDYEEAIASAESFLAISSDVEYLSHHDDVDEDDVHIILAECYYNTGDYDLAREQIDLVGDSDRKEDLSSIIEELDRAEL